MTKNLTFWNIEPPDLGGRLRYHLGQLFALAHSEALIRRGEEAHCVVCDHSSLTDGRYRRSARDDIDDITACIRKLAPKISGIIRLSSLLRTERAANRSVFEARYHTFISNFYRFDEALAGLSVGPEETRVLRRLSDPSQLLDLPLVLQEAVSAISATFSVSTRDAVAVLYAFKFRASWFEIINLANTAALMSSIATRSPSDYRIVEARRNSYVWTFLETVLNAGTATHPWPEILLTNNIPNLTGTAPMKLSDQESCAFIDCDATVLTQALRGASPTASAEILSLFDANCEESITSPEELISYITSARRRLTGLRPVSPNIMMAPEHSSGVDLILKGGGSKGLALLGAVATLSEYYCFRQFIGTSAGAILAALLGAGYSAQELVEILKKTDFSELFSTSGLRKTSNAVLKGGLVDTKHFEDWLRELLESKIGRRPVRLADLPSRVLLVAAQRDRGAVFFDSRGDNCEFDAVAAVRASMSIPWYFTASTFKGQRVYDGGLTANFPYRTYKERFPKNANIAVYLESSMTEDGWSKWAPPTIKDILNIVLHQDDSNVTNTYSEFVVRVDPSPISTLNFALTQAEKSFLLSAGRAAAARYLCNRGLVTEIAAATEAAEMRKLRERVRSHMANSNSGP